MRFLIIMFLLIFLSGCQTMGVIGYGLSDALKTSGQNTNSFQTTTVSCTSSTNQLGTFYTTQTDCR